MIKIYEYDRTVKKKTLKTQFFRVPFLLIYDLEKQDSDIFEPQLEEPARLFEVRHRLCDSNNNTER